MKDQLGEINLFEVKNDVAFGHLFFWALRAVESSPQAKVAVQTDAKRRMHAVQGTICSKAQLKLTLRHLKEANEAVRKGERLPEVPKSDPNKELHSEGSFELLHESGWLENLKKGSLPNVV
ncbi:132 kDa protein [Durusdinium trenchii]|uniref:132 kDa protein n=1 Tax=Durusdinium trenchii TaxID=1381693 RepID=A0ABP0PAI1_9DINO